MELGTEYDYFVALIDATSTDELNADHVVTRMLNEEARHVNGGTTPANQALVAHAPSRNLPKPCKCWRCGDTDHLKSDCDVLEDVECSNCGSEGHLGRACYKTRILGSKKGKSRVDGGLQAMSATLQYMRFNLVGSGLCS
jgi:hypothetical protein